MMHRLVVALALVPLTAFSVAAGDGALPTGSDGAQTVQQPTTPAQPRASKVTKQSAKTSSRPTPKQPSLSSAETYAAEHGAGAPVSAAAKPGAPAPASGSDAYSWTGVYMGAGVGVSR
jgi:hypothetical protein